MGYSRTSSALLFVVALVVSDSFAQDSFTCVNPSYSYLQQTIGNWYVTTKDRTAPGIYENNKGTALISNSIEGCGIKESFRGSYKGNPYGREVTITGIDSVNIQMTTLDSEHGGFSIYNGTIFNNTMTTFWYRDMEVKRLQSKYIMAIENEYSFSFSSYLSTDYGKTWALTHERKYSRINYEEVSFITTDSVKIVGDLYSIDKKHPTILLFHQGGSNAQGEYGTIIPKLTAEGFNVLAIDQRTGGQLYGSYNRSMLQNPPNDFGYCDAYADLESALNFVQSNGYKGKIVLWGSSYSAALAIQLAAKHPHNISGVLAFSPASGGPMQNCRAEEYFKTVSVPVLLLRPTKEMEITSVQNQFELAKQSGLQVYIATYGTHGSSMLVKGRARHSVDENWEVVNSFLKKVNGN